MQCVTSIVISPEELTALVESAVAKALAANPPKPQKNYLDTGDLAEHFGVSKATVLNWVSDDGCPHFKRGKLLRFQLSAVEAWFRSPPPVRKRR